LSGIIISAAHAPALWETLRQTGKPLGLAECGFHAINSLRIEAGHVFFGAELTQAVTPFELGLSRLVDMYLYDFIGKISLLSQRRQTPSTRFARLIPASRNSVLSVITVADIAPLMQSGSGVRVTSACHSPLFNRVIALGFVAPEDAHPGTCVRLSPHITARVARLPFYDAGKILPRRRW
jgi:aminomethyltransferase